MSGGNPKDGRQEDDFYATKPEASHALFKRFSFGDRKIHECACGDGALSKVMETYGYDVVSTDLVDRGYGTAGVDFLALNEPLAPVVITNPPFSLAEDFIEHAMGTLKVEILALLLKSTYWHADARRDLFARHPLYCHAALTFRVDFLNKGRPTMECSWFIWKRGHQGEPVYRLLPKPDEFKKRASRKS